jgi:hypothetical protein
MPKRITWVLGVLALAVGACGDDGGPPPVDAGVLAPDAEVLPPDAAWADAATSGTITVEAEGITGATGKIVLAFVTPVGGGPALGGICEPITTDPASVSAVVKMPGGGDPCTLGADMVFDNGDYDVTAGIYTPGMMMPDQCASTSVTVAGDTVVTLPAFGACP